MLLPRRQQRYSAACEQEEGSRHGCVHCSVARVWMSCALLRARQRFSWTGSLRRLSCRNRFRSRSSGRAQPSAMPKCQRAKMAKDKGEAASARETHASAAPRTGRAAIRLRPGDWTKNHLKNLGAAHRSEQPPPPARTSPGTTDSSHHTTRRPENTPLRERRICSATPSPLCPRRAQAPRTGPKPTRTRAAAPPAPPQGRLAQPAPDLTRPRPKHTERATAARASP